MDAAPGLQAASPTEPASPSASSQPSTTLTDLLPELFRNVVNRLHPNEVAGSVRITCKWAAEVLSDSTTISCKEGPVPAHALAWRFSQPASVRYLTYFRRATVAERAVETGCLATVRLLVTGEGALEDVGALGLVPLCEILAAAARAGQLADAR